MRIDSYGLLTASLIMLSILLSGCGGKRVYAPTPEGEYEQAFELYQNDKYSKAIEAFKQIIYKYPGSDLVEHARYHLADSYFKNGDFVLAADEFERLNREFPQGRFADVALFKAALSYDQLSRRYERDQSETLKALEAMETLLAKYPNTEYADTVRVHNRLLRDRLAKKEYSTAMFYFDMKLYDSAIIYLKSVLESYPNSSSVPDALYHMYLCSVRMGYPDDARDARERLCAEFPDNPLSRRICGTEREPVTDSAMSREVSAGDSSTTQPD